MPQIPAGVLGRFGRGARTTFSAVRPAVPFVVKTVAVAGGIAAVSYGAERVFQAGGQLANDVGRAFHPPLQETKIDPTPGRPGDESDVLFDPKTGQLFVFGNPSTERTTPTRSIASGINWAVLGAAAVGIVAVVFIGGRRR